MALSAQAALLDELMGKNRNAVPGESTRDYRFEDKEVCKHFLCGFCPHELFVNTRADLGRCDKVHDDNLKRDYERSSRRGRLGYEEDFESLLRTLISDVERRIKKGQDRLKLTQGSDQRDEAARNDKIRSLNDQINALIMQSEKMGSEGNVDSAKEVLDRCENLKTERDMLESFGSTGNSSCNQSEQNQSAQQSLRHIQDNVKTMEVCTTCGSFLIVGDAQCRVEEHITGKQHVGYAKIRNALEEMRTRKQKLVEEKMKKEEAERMRKVEHRSSKLRDDRKSCHRSGSKDGKRDRSSNAYRSSSHRELDRSRHLRPEPTTGRHSHARRVSPPLRRDRHVRSRSRHRHSRSRHRSPIGIHGRRRHGGSDRLHRHDSDDEHRRRKTGQSRRHSPAKDRPSKDDVKQHRDKQPPAVEDTFIEPGEISGKSSADEDASIAN